MLKPENATPVVAFIPMIGIPALQRPLISATQRQAEDVTKLLKPLPQQRSTMVTPPRCKH